MFKNRELSITMHKADKDKDKDEVRDETAVFEDRVALVHTVTTDVVKTIFAGVCAHVVLDTFRQVLVQLSKNAKK